MGGPLSTNCHEDSRSYKAINLASARLAQAPTVGKAPYIGYFWCKRRECPSLLKKGNDLSRNSFFEKLKQAQIIPGTVNYAVNKNNMVLNSIKDEVVLNDKKPVADTA